MRLKGQEYATDTSIIQEGCGCQACREGISRARLHTLLKTGNPLAVELVTQHNIAYMMSLIRSMRQAILEDRYPEYVQSFINDQFPKGIAGDDQGGCPVWVRNALSAAGIEIV